MYKVTISLFIIFSLFSCKEISNKNQKTLRATNKQISIPIDSDTKIYTRAMHHFISEDGVEYLTIENSETIYDYNSISFYRLDSCRLSHKVLIQKEGSNGVYQFGGHSVINLDTIYLSALGRPIIYQINKSGKIVKEIKFESSDNGEPCTELDFNSLIYKPIIIKDSKIYGTQFPLRKDIGEDDFKDIPLAVIIDTCNKSIKKSKLSYPKLWKSKNNMGYNTHCSRIFDGKQFIYAFLKEENIIVTKDHIHAQYYPIKSKYIQNISNEGFSRNLSFDDFVKKADEDAVYGNILYDKYRNIYYRFAYPKCQIKKPYFEYIFCKKEFSIIIFDENFKVIGETLFPAGKYAPGLFFINKDGLHLSENNIENINNNEEILRFRCFTISDTNNK